MLNKYDEPSEKADVYADVSSTKLSVRCGVQHGFSDSGQARQSH